MAKYKFIDTHIGLGLPTSYYTSRKGFRRKEFRWQEVCFYPCPHKHHLQSLSKNLVTNISYSYEFNHQGVKIRRKGGRRGGRRLTIITKLHNPKI